MVAHRLIALALLSSVLFQGAAKATLDDASFDVVTRELEADLDLGDLSDVDEDLRRLQAANDTTTTLMATTTTPKPKPKPTAPPTKNGPKLTGSMTITGMDSTQANAFIAKNSTKEAFKKAIANLAKADGTLSKDAVDVMFSVARRLQEALADGLEARALQSASATITADYEIFFPVGTATSELTAMQTTLTSVTGAQLKTAVIAELPAADVTAYGNLMTVTMIAPVVVEQTTTTTAPTETDGAAKMVATSSMLALAAAWLASTRA